MKKPRKFPWQPNPYAGFEAVLPDNITLVVSPDQTKGFQPQAKRGTTWRAQASHWDGATKTISRFGRDEYRVQHKTKQEAMRAAERIYEDAVAGALNEIARDLVKP